MNRSINVWVILALLLVVAISAASVAPAFAVTTYHEYISTRGFIVVNIPNHPEIELLCQHFDATSDHGAANTLFLFMLAPKQETYHGGFIHHSRASNIPTTTFCRLPMGNNAILVDNCNLQICRIGKTALAYWTVPIEGSITGNVPGTNVHGQQP